MNSRFCLKSLFFFLHFLRNQSIFPHSSSHLFFFFNDTAPPEISPLSLHDALPIWDEPLVHFGGGERNREPSRRVLRQDRHESLEQPVEIVRHYLTTTTPFMNGCGVQW